MAPQERRGPWRRLRHSLLNEPERVDTTDLPNPILAISPLILVGVANFALTRLIPQWYGAQYTVDPQIPGAQAALSVATKGVVAIWAVQGALLLGILLVLLTAFRRVYERFAAGTKTAVSGALLATLNTASEYGFGGVIAALPGFIVVSDAPRAFPTRWSMPPSRSRRWPASPPFSGGMSIALAAMSDTFIQAAQHMQIPLEVLHAWSPWPAAAWTRCRTTARSSRCWPSPACRTASPIATSSP